MSYFYAFGRCDHCDWPHHVRYDRRAKPKRWWRRKAKPATSFVACCNCGKRTKLDDSDGEVDH